MVDDDDYLRVRRFKWRRLTKAGYIGRQTGNSRLRNRETILLHRVLMDAPKGIDVDHRNQKPWDNRRRKNLRLASRSQNLGNMRPRGGSSKFKGVWWCPYTERWAARLNLRKARQWLGRHDSEVAAARAYDAAAFAHFGEFARLNFPVVP